MSRREMLEQILRENPSDAFARYGLAMEFANVGDSAAALQEFEQLLAAHPDYTAGYFMAAQTLAKGGRLEDARKYLTDGIASAARTGNQHAQSEMQGMLDSLG